MGDDAQRPFTRSRARAPSLLREAATGAEVPDSDASGDPQQPVDLEQTSDEQDHGEQPRYRPRRTLGEGGIGKILLCKDLRTRRDVALKQLQDYALEEPDIRRRFEREARVQAQLEHPSIVPVYDLSSHPDGAPLFTMRRVCGLTLEDIIEALGDGDPELSALFTRHRLLTAFCSVCLTVAYAHSRGVIHRDLKPANIMFGEFGEVSVLDWGLCKVLTEHQDEPASRRRPPEQARPSIEDQQTARTVHAATMDGAILGTPGYMPPEQSRGDHSDVSGAADIYSLGAILFELLTFEPLIERQHPPELMVIAAGFPAKARPSERYPETAVPLELEEICVRATQLEPAERFASARELCDAVQAYLEGSQDLAQRRVMAEQHLDEARIALKSASMSNAASKDATNTDATNTAALLMAGRTRAAQQLRLALGLMPDHEGARSITAQLLLKLPQDIDPATERQMRAALGQHRPAKRLGAVIGLGGALIAAAAIALWMGVRNWTLYSLWLLSLAAMMAAGARLARHDAAPSLGPFLFALAAYLGIQSTVAGPLFLLPGVALTVVTMTILLRRANKQQRGAAMATCVCAMLLPLALQLAGVVPRSYLFADGLMSIHSGMLELPALPTMVTLLVSAVATLVIPALVVGRWVDRLVAVEQDQALRHWRLKHLVPESTLRSATDEPAATGEGEAGHER